MRRTLLLALSLTVAAAPAALAYPGSGDHPRDRGDRDGAHAKPATPTTTAPAAKAKGPKGTHHLLHACVVSEGKADGVALSVLGGNRHMKRALGLDGVAIPGGAFTAPLDGETVVRLVGKARHLPAGSVPKRTPKIGTHADLDPGDRVIVRFRATRGTAATKLPAAFKVIDRGPTAKCAPADATPTTGEQPVDGGPAL